MGSSSPSSFGTSGRMCDRSTRSIAAAATPRPAAAPDPSALPRTPPLCPPAPLPLPYSSSSSSSVCSTSLTMRRQKKRVSPPSPSALTTLHSAGNMALSTAL